MNGERRWRRRLLWVLPFFLATYCLVRVTDYAWYTYRCPPEVRSARWGGEWRTAKYFGLSGRLLVRLPDPLPEGKEFQAEAVVYYPVYSTWKPGQFVRMEFAAQFQPDAPSAGRTTNDIPGGGKLKFKGVVGNQVVEYTALVDERREVITGGYLSRSPDDYGTFVVERY